MARYCLPISVKLFWTFQLVFFQNLTLPWQQTVSGRFSLLEGLNVYGVALINVTLTRIQL